MDILKLGHFTFHFHFPVYHKAPKPSTNASAATTVMNDTTGTGLNPLTNKYIYSSIYLIYFPPFVVCYLRKSKNGVAGFLLNPSFNPLGTF